MADNVAVIFSAQIGQLISGVDEVKQAIQSITSPIGALTSTLGTFGEAFAAAFAVDKVQEFFGSMTELAVQTQRTAALLGISTSAVSGLDIAAKASGTSLESVTMSLERFGRNLALGASGSVQQAAGLRALGLSAKDFIGLPLPDTLAKLADHFAVLKDGIDKDAIAMALLGRGGAQMIPVFNQGSAAFREFAAMAERTGTALSQNVKNAFEQTHLKVIELDKSFEGAGVTIAASVLPAYNGLVKVLSDLTEAFTASARSGGAMQVLLNTLLQSLQGVEIAVVAAGVAIAELWAVTKQTVFYIGESFLGLGRVIKDVFTFNWGDIGASWNNLQAQLAARNAMTAKEMVDTWQTAVGEVRTILGIGAENAVQIEQKKDARLNLVNKDGVSAALAAAQEKIRIADLQYQQAAEKINSEFKLMQITESQKTQALLAALDVRHNAELAALDQELAVGGQSKAQYQKVLNEKLTLDQKYANDRQKIIDQAAQDEAKTWKAGADQVAAAFNGQLQKLLSGQETFAQAMKAISAQLALDMIKDSVKWATEHIAEILRVQVADKLMNALGLTTTVTTEAAKTTAVTTGAAARATAESTGATTGILAQIGNALAVITADAAKTFAGVFAFLAPAMGPAAAGPAASSAAAVEAAAGSLAVPGLAVGTDYVLSPGLAFLHSGETVVPAQTSGPYTGGGQGTSMSVAFNVNAIDGNSVQAFFQKNAGQISRVLTSHMNQNPSFNTA